MDTVDIFNTIEISSQLCYEKCFINKSSEDFQNCLTLDVASLILFNHIKTLE